MQEWNEASLSGDSVATEQDGVQGPRMIEAPERDTSNPESFVTELASDTPFFEARGVAHIKIGPTIRTFQIRSVPAQEWEAARELLRPKPWPRKFDRKTQTWVDDFDSPELMKFVGMLGYAKTVLGLCIPIRNRQGQICWQHPGDMRFLRQAIDALKDQGITEKQVDSFVKAIDALSEHDQEEEATRILGESDDVSGSRTISGSA